MQIRVADKVSAYHRWPDAPDHRKYLSYPHLHEFEITLWFEVDSPERQLEFHDIRSAMHQALKSLGAMYHNSAEPNLDFGTMSCESIAIHMLEKFPGALECCVDEDDFGGATVFHEDVYDV